MGDDDKHASRREKILQESLESSNQPSWGYFGLGGSLAIGDNSYAPILKRRPKAAPAVAKKPASKVGTISGECLYIILYPDGHREQYTAKQIKEFQDKTPASDETASVMKKPAAAVSVQTSLPEGDQEQVAKKPAAAEEAPDGIEIEEEEEIAEPMRQIQCNPPKKGAGPDAFFTFETSIGLGDPYQDASYAIKKGRVQHLNPEAAFMPPGKIGWSVNKLGYEYIDHKDTAKDPKAIKEKYTDYMPPRQILTNPPKKGGGGTLTQGVLFGFGGERNAHPGYVEDDYNAPRKLRMKELEEHKSKLQEAPFKQNDHGYRNFQADQELFQQEPGSNVPREKKQVQLTKPYPHEVPFRPANPPKKGVPTKPVKEGETRDYLGGTYEYIGDPEVKTVRKPKSDEPEKAPFRGCVPKSFANPMPSVVCNTRNMRAERPSSFVRPSL